MKKKRESGDNPGQAPTTGDSAPRPRRSRSGGRSRAARKDQGKNQEKTAAKGQGSRSRTRGGAKSGSSSHASSSRRRQRGGQSSRSGGQSRSGAGRGRRNVRRSVATPRMRVSKETSAGGLVISGLAEAVAEDGTVDLSRIYVALIGRLDRRGRLLWSMPKGHVEPGEDIPATAEREVWEETGIHGEVIAELGVIDYWFVSEGKRIHKTVHHHLLRFVDGHLNDEDPEVTEVAWIPASALSEHFAYADERKLARTAHTLLPDFARKEKAAGRATPR